MKFVTSVINNSLCRWIFRIGITLLFVVLVNRGVTFDEVKSLTISMDFVRLSFALLFGMVSFLFQVLRWHAILRIQGFTATPSESFSSFAWGSLLAFITPGRLGELGRGLSLDPHRKADSVASVVIDKVFATLATLLFGLAAIGVQLLFTETFPPGRLLLGMGILFVVASVTIPLSVRFIGRAGYSGKAGAVIRSVRRVAGALPQFFTARILCYSCATHIALLLQTATLLTMFGSGSVISNLIIACEAYAFMLLVPIFIANIGLREYSFGMMFDAMRPALTEGLSMTSIALGLSTLILLMNVVLPAVAGLLVMFFDKKRADTFFVLSMPGEGSVCQDPNRKPES